MVIMVMIVLTLFCLDDDICRHPFFSSKRLDDDICRHPKIFFKNIFLKCLLARHINIPPCGV